MHVLAVWTVHIQHEHSTVVQKHYLLHVLQLSCNELHVQTFNLGDEIFMHTKRTINVNDMTSSDTHYSTVV